MSGSNEMVAAYDRDAEASGWYGPEGVFGLTYTYIEPGQSMLDIGIGTGLSSVLFRKAGLIVHGMDNSQQMLDACRNKGFTALQMHDLTMKPYPYDSGCMDLVVCTGGFNFFKDLSPAFDEAGRILRKGGLFGFVIATRAENQANEITIRADQAKTDYPVTLYLHHPQEIDHLIDRYKFRIMRSLSFTMNLDQKKTKTLHAKAILVDK